MPPCHRRLSPAVFVLLGVALAGCGSDTAEGVSAVEETSTTDAGAPRRTSLPAGSWTGEGTFTQTWASSTVTVQHLVNLMVGEDGIPKAMPSLGMVEPWAVYLANEQALALSPGATLETGGTVWTFCRAEKGGTSNAVEIEPLAHSAEVGAVEWRYRARYRFADLLRYGHYDYAEPGAPLVAVEARDRYELDRTGGTEVLRMSGQAEGTRQDTGEPLALSFEVRLTRGHSLLPDRCQLGPRSLAP
jgi:hypothetical protein